MKQILWDQACRPVVIELLKDEIFNAIYSYMPQVSITRDDIDVKVDGNIVHASIEVKADSKIPSDLFNIEILLDQE
jgi:hypothetical protein